MIPRADCVMANRRCRKVVDFTAMPPDIHNRQKEAITPRTVDRHDKAVQRHSTVAFTRCQVNFRCSVDVLRLCHPLRDPGGGYRVDGRYAVYAAET